MRTDLRLINSMTKYPSIPTYHEIGNKGVLNDVLNVDFLNEPDVILTEKIDGANARVIFTPDYGGYFIGSREELFCYEHDLVYNPMLGIVDALRGTANILGSVDRLFTAFYFEVFGGGVGQNYKNYTTSKDKVHVRLFDIMTMELDQYDMMLGWSTEEIAGWRDRGNQHFLTEPKLRMQADRFIVDVTPRIKTVVGDTLPPTISTMHNYLTAKIPTSSVTIDTTGRGKAEGLVVRTPDRSKIAKIRFEDYERTARAVKV